MRYDSPASLVAVPPPVEEAIAQPAAAMPDAVAVGYWPRSVQVNETVTIWFVHVPAV